jgi:twitching motility protein PilT
MEPTAPLASSLRDLLLSMEARRASDLFLCEGKPPTLRIHGQLVPLDLPPSTREELGAVLQEPLSPAQRRVLEEQGDLDVGFSPAPGRRFRLNLSRQQGLLAAVIRALPSGQLDFGELGLPRALPTLFETLRGLVLVTGATGSGKSTTLAALVDAINRGSGRHIITLEDPIEVVHPRHRSLVNQREVGTHTGSYEQALRATLRQDPDVLLVGELRDLPTIAFAVTAAETGHLVLGTVHTVSADTSLDRVINAFPAGRQEQVRAMLAGSLRAVVCQYLLPRADGKGRALACEVMLNNDAVANLIRSGKCYQLPSVIATSRELGMQAMDTELLRLYKDGSISADTAYMKARNKKDFESLVGPHPAGDNGPALPA